MLEIQDHQGVCPNSLVMKEPPSINVGTVVEVEGV
jgi:hypothetical protein